MRRGTEQKDSTLLDISQHQLDIEQAKFFECPKPVLNLFKTIETPDDLQNWLGKLGYEHRYIYPPLIHVLQEKRADCFTGMLTAVAWGHLRGYDPKVVVLEAKSEKMGADHNIVVFKGHFDGTTKYGSVAKSDWMTLTYRPFIFDDIETLVRSYRGSYTSEIKKYAHKNNLQGFSDPFDPMEKVGTLIFFKVVFSPHESDLKATLEIYKEYTRGLMCTDFNGKRYHYPQKDSVLFDPAERQRQSITDR